MENPIDFIKLLKSQHKEILTTVCDIDSQAGGASSLNNSIEKLNKITEILFDHLEKEDKVLYPTLINNKDSSDLAKKYFYDMERLSCIAVDFFKRYCLNKEGLKIFIEDFINSYSIFKGLLKIRIKREETELYPSFLLMHTGDINVIQESKKKENQKKIILFGHNQASNEALALGLEISGYQVSSTRLIEQVSSLEEKLQADLIMLDVSKATKELQDLIMHLRKEVPTGMQIVGYSTTEPKIVEENLKNNLNDFIPKATYYDMEVLAEKIKQLLEIK